MGIQKTKIELINTNGDLKLLDNFESVGIEESIDTKIKMARVQTSTLSKSDMNLYGVGTEIRIYTAPVEKEYELIFVGIMTTKARALSGIQTSFELTASDYISKTQQIIVNESFTGYKITDIIRSLMEKYMPDFPIHEIHENEFDIKRINFNDVFLYTALEKLCDMIDYTFRINLDKSFSFFNKRSKVSDVSFKQDEFSRSTANFSEDYSLIVNRLIVKGGMELSNNQLYWINGTALDSILPYKPRAANMNGVEGVILSYKVNGVTKQETVGIDGLHSTGFKVLVNYNEKLIKMINSITGEPQSLSVSIPNGSEFALYYRFETPIHMEYKKTNSIEKYGRHDDILELKYIDNRELIRKIVIDHLDRYATPVIQGSFDTWKYEGYEAGEMIQLKIITDTDFTVNDSLLLSRRGIAIEPNTIKVSLDFQEHSKLSSVIKSIMERIKDVEDSFATDETVEKVETFDDEIISYSYIYQNKTIKKPYHMRIGGLLGVK